MGDAVTQEEIVEIVTGFLLNSPPGEFMEVVTDVRGLLSDESIINASAPATFREYNTDQMLQVQSPAGHKFLITKFGEVDRGNYLDPRGKKVVAFDHIRQEVTGSRSIKNELDSSIENWRSAIDEIAARYTVDHYVNGTSTVYAKKEGSNVVVTICISSAKFQPNNFWNGRWRSVWTVKFGTKGGQATLTGKIRVNVHYYEDGNVQLTTNTPKQVQAGGNDPKSMASSVIKAIAAAEHDYQARLEHSYVTMSDTTFKALRRVLPITRVKIDWSKILNYRIGGAISGN